MRTVVRPLLVEFSLLVAFVVAVSFLVSIPNVITNMTQLGAASQYGSYLLGAFVHTRLAVQVSLILAGLIFAFLIKDIIKNLKYLRQNRFV